MGTSSLPSHGRISCSRCFDGYAEWGRSEIEENGWTLENNPMAWGSSDPKILVLGFSKGVRQTGSNLSLPFEKIAFAGMRARLAECLDSLGVMSTNRSFDDLFLASERDFAFGSLIRCSVAHVPAGTDKSSKSGEIINALARRPDGTDWAGNCITQFLSDLPSRLRLVVLMSNDDDYVDACFNRITRVRQGLRRLNEVAYADDRVTFVHIAHCSGTSVSHQQKWLARSKGRQGDKARLADETVRGAGYEPKSLPPATTIPRLEALLKKSRDAEKRVPTGQTETSPSTRETLQSDLQIPKAKDGSIFLPETRRSSGYQIGAKGAEIYVQSYDEALHLLKRMNPPRWRRPNENGVWGIVIGVEWIRLDAREDEVT